MSKYDKIYRGEVAPIGVMGLSNWGGLEVFEINEQFNTCISGFNWGEETKDVRETSIHFSYSGRPYIIRYQKAYYFDEIERINI